MANQKLVDYIKAQLAKGKKVDDVRGALLAQGWSEKDIAEAVSAAAAVPIPPAPGAAGAPKSRKKLKIAVAVVGIILIVVALIGILFPGLLF